MEDSRRLGLALDIALTRGEIDPPRSHSHFKEEESMERKADNPKDERSQAVEAAYRRGYHHGLSQAIDLISGLLTSGIPLSATADLCHVFEQQVIIPWRSAESAGSSAPPRFDLEECQRLLRELKENQSD